jgi:hypothetical protein
MTALSKFLDRHGLDDTFRAKAGFYAALGTIAAATALAPLDARSQDSYMGHDSPIGGSGMAQRIEMIAVRTNDRIADMVQIRRAIAQRPDLSNPHDGSLAASILIEVNNRLYRDTPHPGLAKFDMTPLGLPDNLAEGAAMEYAVGAINFQKETLLKSTEALKVIVDAYVNESPRRLRQGIALLDEALETYRVSEERVLENITSSLEEMRTDEGWVRGRTVNF